MAAERRLFCIPAAILVIAAIGLTFFPFAACWAESASPPIELAAVSADALASETPTAEGPSRARRLYARHCADCHGENGDGNGPAAKYLFPKPRDFRAGRFRLVSSSNNVPTRDDLLAVLRRGMPGSSMPPWSHLAQADLEALVDEAMRLRREGAHEQYLRILKEEEELTDEELAAEDVQAEIQDYVDRFTTPADATMVPDLGPSTLQGLAAAKESYSRAGCLQCHGAEGRGDGVQKQVDDEKYPTSPRDFTRGIFKGGDDPTSLYRRIAYGMPGTPMPGSQVLTPQQIGDLVHFIRSMSTESERSRAALKRQTMRAKRVKKIPAAADEKAWSAVPAAALQTMPLWWRDDADVELRVQSAHDGDALAVRLTWLDATQSDGAVKPDAFEDMVAAEFCVAGDEPFLGMGSADAQVDVWQWRAGAAQTGAEDSRLDEYPFDTDVYRTLKIGDPFPDFLTARAARNPLAVRDRSGSHLTAKGPGTTTYLPSTSQFVTADGWWKEGRWSVTLVRPLDVRLDEGLPLGVGKAYAAAFAIWDGALRDRAGQKLVTVWNDFKLE